MSPPPCEFVLELEPRARFDAIDVNELLRRRHGPALEGYRRALYCSLHTTAGYLEQGLTVRLARDRERLDSFFRVFDRLFPRGAPYQHDRLELRAELSEEQRRREPRNADSHLKFIGSGLRSCVTYVNRPERPVYFIDLDGVNGEVRRRRKTTVVGFDREEVVRRLRIPVPVSRHPIDSVNLKDPRLGLFPRLEEELTRCGVDRGRIRISLAPTERHAGLTVNEYETLLMRHDLAEVLHDPLRFVADRIRHAIRDPRAVPNKTRNYAQYDLVQVMKELLDALHISESRLERYLAKFIARPASRFFRMRDSISLLVSRERGSGKGAIVQGRYQSPILVQWERGGGDARKLDVVLTRFR
ncbi:MAG: hypothetical protein D6718_08175 [Acidobacteria bacterium]|nr:MAG: hypothetical protein D6718_08175 [Acidobacteriota bacterium]